MNPTLEPAQIPRLPMDLQIAVQQVHAAVGMISRHPCPAYRTIAMTLATQAAINALAAPFWNASLQAIAEHESGIPNPTSNTNH
jgi:hypothetical protein